MKIAGVIAMGLIMTLAICLTASSVDQIALRSQVANLGMSEYTWTDSNFAGFYYDIDKNIGTEQLTFRLSDITPDSAILSDQPDAYGLRGIVYTTQALPKNFKFRPWGQYEIIGFLSDEYFAAYDNTITSGMQAASEDVAYLYDESKTNNLLNNEQISRILIDDDTEQAITSDHPLKLSEGYQLAIKSLDVTTKKADLELSRNGQVIDNKVVQPSIPNAKMIDKTYYYKVNFGDTKDIVQLAVHFKNAFKSGTVNIATVDGVFQISDNFEQIKIDRTYDNMSIRMVNPTNMTIILDNKDHQITLSKGKDIHLMSNLYVRASNQDTIDSNQPIRYYIYSRYTDPGSYQLRGSIAKLGQNEFTWDRSTFPEFYYDIDNDLGSEHLTFRLTNSNPERATLSDQPDTNGFRGIVYTTQAQPKNFKFKPWGQYEVIGFISQNNFVAYDNTITANMQTAGESTAYLFDQSRDRNLMVNDQIGKVLIDTDTEQTITSTKPLELAEGYELAIKSVDTSDKKAYLELSKNGQVLDHKTIQPSIVDAKMSDKTYYYSADLGDAKQIVQIAVHFKNAFVGSDTNIATIDGIFQISDSTTPIKVDQQYDKMSIRTVDSSSLSITMDNKDNQVILSKNKDILLMKDIHIKTADQEDISAENPLRYHIYETTTIGNPPKQIPNQPPVITSFVSSRGNNTLTGEPVIFTAMVSDPDIKDQVLYRFFLNGEPVTDWFSKSQWTWTPTTSEVGNNQVEVRVIDQSHAEKIEFDDKRDLTVRIESKQPPINPLSFNRPPVITNFVRV